MVEFLIDKVERGMDRQHSTAKEGQAEVAPLLVRKGMNPNIRDLCGFYSIDWSKKKKSTEMV